jgi:gliding motility-associated-like protein
MKTVTVLPGLPVAKISGYGSACPPLDVTFNVNFKFSDTAVVDFGDGTSKKIFKPFPATVSHTYTTAGSYVSKVTAIGPGGSTTVSNDSLVWVQSPPTVNFGLNPSQINLPDSTLYLTNNTLGNWNYHWDFGDGSVSTLQDPIKHYYTQPGIYSIKLVANGNGCTNSLTKTFKVLPPPPVAKITGYGSYCPPLNVNFKLSFNYADSAIVNFGDGTNQKIYQPFPTTIAHTYNSVGTYVAKMTALGQGGSTTVANDSSITVMSPPNVNFAFSPSQLNLPDSTLFITNNTLGDWSYNWDFGDGSLANLQDPIKHYYDQAGTYSIKLIADGNGCTNSLSKTIKVLPPPPVAKISGYGKYCPPLNVNFNLNFKYADTAIVDFGDGTAQKLYQPFPAGIAHTYNSVGTYVAKLTAIGAGGVTTVANDSSIAVLTPPNVNFTFSPSELKLPDTTLYITNTTTGNWSYHWNFGDGSSSTLKDPLTHYYDQDGTYAIKLVAEGYGCFNSITKPINVMPPPPVAKIAGHGKYCPPLNVNFNVNFKFSDTATVDFGDGTIKKIYQPFPSSLSHTYTSPGKYVAKLTASGPGGVSSVVNDSVIWIQTPPDVNFSFSLSQLKLPDTTLYFTNNTLGNWQYVWDFGDGETSNLKDPVNHNYYDPGTYNIRLIAQGNGCVDTLTKPLTVLPGPPLAKIYGYGHGCSPMEVPFTIDTKFADTIWVDFGDGNKKRFTKPFPLSVTHAYLTPSNYIVKLTAKGPGGFYTVINDSIIVTDSSPMAEFAIKPKVIELNQATFFSNSSKYAVSYLWDFGDGSTSTEKMVFHTYKNPGLYDVVLVAKNSAGCTDTLKLVAAVEVDPDAIILIPNAFTPSLAGPNGGNIANNGLNDVFYPLTENLSEFNMLIFNRWGELIFESNDANIGWDGYLKGKLCKEDVYVYKIKGKTAVGAQKEFVGDVTLIHKH